MAAVSCSHPGTRLQGQPSQGAFNNEDDSKPCIDEAETDGAAAASRRQHRALGSYRPTEAGRLKGHLDTTLSNSSASLSHLDSRRLAALKAAKKASGGAMTVATTGQMAVGEGGVVNDKHKTYLLP